ncbi:MAG: hypothetical protein CVV21_08425 [Candidatus Goldiibacteriota bacterium HGW-Goldbacteria-1]|jgi:[acyl-carrier-protein] S-malonyltransferase|nr:MAG: hypothetical protein CVV21_08425 [Candidatus Goldiibacteriota bacterium HGW-Goldbacteria-1]
MAAIGYLFTAAGYQYVGAGRKVYDSMWAMRQFFDRVEKKMPDVKINKLAFIGPQEELQKPENGTIFNGAYQAGMFEVLKEKKVTPEQIMGFRSGELIAHACAGTFEFEDAMAFIYRKNILFKEALGSAQFSQLLINTLDTGKTAQVCGEINRAVKCGITSYNSSDSATVAVESKLKEKVIEAFKKLGGSVIDLPYEELSGLYLFKEAADKLTAEFGEAIKNEVIKVDKPAFKMYSQVKGDMYDNAAEIKQSLFNYLYLPSRNDLIIHNMMKNCINTFVELGCGTFLGRLARKADSGKRVLNTHDLAGISTAIKLAN